MLEVKENNGRFVVEFSADDVRDYATREQAQDAVAQKLERAEICDSAYRVVKLCDKVEKGAKLSAQDKATRELFGPVVRCITSELDKSATDDEIMSEVANTDPEALRAVLDGVYARITDIQRVMNAPKISVSGLDGSVQMNLTRLVTNGTKRKESATVTRDTTSAKLYGAINAYRNAK